MVNRLVLLCVSVLACTAQATAEHPYLTYVKNAPEFKPVRQDRELLVGRWDTWIYMPWRFQWTVGAGDEGGEFCCDYGFNGGFTDHGGGPFEWLNKWNL
jgi:hypothetical protein